MPNPIDPNVDPYGYLGMVRNPDGSITRLVDVLSNTPPCSDPSGSTLVLTKDIAVNESTNTSVRLFLPRQVLNSDPAPTLPVIVYYHGGGFVVGSAASSLFQGFCNKVATEIPAVIVSSDYRLAPEHRLPAAYDDGLEVLRWIKTTNDEWLTKYADRSNCYLMGSSAGGNMAYNIGSRAVWYVDDLDPVKIRGLILQQPFFGGVERTQSELRLSHDKVVPLCVNDIMWELALPIGADRDHEFCNPMTGIKLEVINRIMEYEWQILIIGSDGDPLVDRQIELAKVLNEKNLRVVSEFIEGAPHGFEVLDDSPHVQFLLDALKKFMKSL